MKVSVIEGKKGYSEIDLDVINDDYAITEDKELRLLCLGKKKYRLTLKSFKELRNKGCVPYKKLGDRK